VASSDPKRADQKHCAEHNVWYGKLEQCGICRAARSLTTRTESPKADTHELAVRESEYRETDKYLRKLGRDWIDEGTPRERNVALKAFDTAAKFARIAYEIRQWRTEIEHEQWLAAQKRLLDGGGN
jgi:hypothetical protein